MDKLHAYLLRIYYNKPIREMPPVEKWVKANNVLYAKEQIYKSDPSIREIEVLNRIKLR